MPQAKELVRIRRLISSSAQRPTFCSIGERKKLPESFTALASMSPSARVGGDRAPAGEDVEEPEPNDRIIERARNDVLGIARFLGVVGRHLEANPRPEGHEDADRCRARSDVHITHLLRRNRRVDVEDVESLDIELRRARRDGAGIEDQQHDHFENKRNTEDFGRKLDVPIGQDRDQRDHEHRKPDPGNIVAKMALDPCVAEVGEETA